MPLFESLLADLAEVRAVRHFGRVTEMQAATVKVKGLSLRARLGDRVLIGDSIGGEILAMNQDGAEILPEGEMEGMAIGDSVEHLGRNTIAPDTSWIGRVIDPYGVPLDGRPLARGPKARALRSPSSFCAPSLLSACEPSRNSVAPLVGVTSTSGMKTVSASVSLAEFRPSVCHF